ncbi:hypothetical protein N8737_03855 [Verrucomicrobia bacterium]|nr:hypothetical protein [Verrucomicrobiota bacterium]MDA7657817.1 hypothetical protein [Verrucomicrobiota bacterium]
MSLLLRLLAQSLRCVALLCGKDGMKAVVVQNLLLTQQLIILNRGEQRCPSISPLHRIWLAFFSMFLSTRRLRQVAVVFRLSTCLRFKSRIGSNGPSWLTFIGHSKDSRWSMDFFNAESILLKSYSVMVIMDQFSRRIIGYAVHSGDVDGEALCSMFREIVSNIPTPNYLSLDNDPLHCFDRWAPELEVFDKPNLFYSFDTHFASFRGTPIRNYTSRIS